MIFADYTVSCGSQKTRGATRADSLNWLTMRYRAVLWKEGRRQLSIWLTISYRAVLGREEERQPRSEWPDKIVA